MADDRTFKLKIISPDRMFYEGDVVMVELRTTEGEIGVYKNHSPITAVLAPGILSIHENDEVKYAALHGGFVEILQDSVTVLAEVVEWPGEIDVKRAEEAKKRAERRLLEKENDTDIARATLALQRAVARTQAVKIKV